MTLDETIEQTKQRYPQYFEGADNAVEDLLRSPAIANAESITWCAAGEKNTWLRIDKTINGIELQTYECGANSLSPEQEMPAQWFRHRTLRPEPTNSTNLLLDEDMSLHYWAIAQLAAAGFDAWNRGDRTMHWEAIAMLAQHVPSVMDLVLRANALPPDDLYTPAYKIGYAMQQTDALEALSDEPRGQAMLDPWFRAQQLIRLTSSAHRVLASHEGHPALYALESEKGQSYLFVYPTASSDHSAANIWFDAKMQPLLIDYESNAQTGYLESMTQQWEYPRPYPKGMRDWQQAFQAMPRINDAPFESLRSGAMRTLSPKETLQATLQWSRGAKPMQDWNDVDAPSALLAFGQWAMDFWKEHDHQYGPVIHGLAASLDPHGPPAQLDALRELLSVRPNLDSPAETMVSSEELSQLI